MMRCAASGSFQRSGFSAWEFSSDSFFLATSRSKMPPQQRQRLLDGIDQGLNFRAHDRLLNPSGERRRSM